MKKIILLTLTALMGCNIEQPSHCQSIYFGDKWDVFKMNDSIYLMIPKYEEYSTPYVLNMKDKDNCQFSKECKQKELKELVEQLKEK